MEDIQMDQLELNNDEMSRRKDPDYTQTCGMLPRSLIAELKYHCFKRDITQSVALEEAVRIWIQIQESKKEESDREGDQA